MIATAFRSLKLIEADQRLRWLGLAGLSVVATGLEVLGAVLVYLLLSMIADPGGEIALPLVGDVRARVSGVAETDLLLATAALMAVFFVLRGSFQAFVSYLHARVAHTAGARLASRLTAGYLALPLTFHLRRNSAESIRNVHAAATQVVTGALMPLINITAAMVVVAGLLVVMVAVSPLATGLAVVVIGAASLSLLRVVQPRLKWYGATSHLMGRRLFEAVQHALRGLADIKLLGRERFFSRRFDQSVDELAHVSYLRAAFTGLPRIVMETALIVFILLYFGASVLAGRDSTEVLSVLGVFAYAGLRLQPLLSSVVSGLNELRFASAVVDDILTDLEVIEGVASAPARPPRPLRDRITLHEVTFHYPDSETPAVSEVDLEVVRGTAVGLCGPTGGGKSTLVHLVTGLLDPTSGSVRIDGAPLADDRRGWQRNLGVVPQTVFLVDDTVRRNVALGVDDDEIDEELLHEAIGLAQLAELVTELPSGLDTLVGEDGIRLSGGQRQRIAIARALYRRADVLVFDEGTSALDNLTEVRLLADLRAARDDLTLIMVAHRLTTVESCDQLLLIDDGRVRARGTYEELLELSDEFRRLVRRGS